MPVQIPRKKIVSCLLLLEVGAALLSVGPLPFLSVLISKLPLLLDKKSSNMTYSDNPGQTLPLKKI